MIGVVVVSHGRLADEFVAAAEHVLGPQDQMRAVAIGPYDNMEERRADIIDAVRGVDRGDGVETGLTDNEIAGFAGLLGGAGAETVTKLVGNAVVLFADRPDVWQRVRDDPTCVPQAVEEVLRLLPPSQYQGRFSVEDREYEGGTIPAGHPVLLLTGAATRDPRAFDRPDEHFVQRRRREAQAELRQTRLQRLAKFVEFQLIVTQGGDKLIPQYDKITPHLPMRIGLLRPAVLLGRIRPRMDLIGHFHLLQTRIQARRP